MPVNPVNSYFMSTWQVTPPQNCPFYPRFVSRSNHLTNLMTKIGQRGWRIWPKWRLIAGNKHLYWLVALAILKNMSSSMGRMTTHILWKIKHVWNKHLYIMDFPLPCLTAGGYIPSNMHTFLIVAYCMIRHVWSLCHLHLHVFPWFSTFIVQGGATYLAQLVYY